MRRYHQSQLKLSCPRAVYLYGTQTETLPPDKTELGTKLHQAFADKDWAKIEELGFKSEAIQALYKEHPDMEAEKYFELPMGEEYGVAGTIDLMWTDDNGVNICDIKSAYQYRDELRKQLEVYSLHAFSLSPQLPISLWIYYAQHDWMSRIATLDTLDKDRIYAWVIKAIERVQRIEAGELPKGEPCAHCTWCQYALNCPDVPVGVMDIRTDPVGFANNYLLLKEKTKHFQKILKTYCQSIPGQVIETNDRIVGYHSSQRLVIDEQGALDYLTSKGRSVYDILMVSVVKFKEVCKEDDGLTAFAEGEVEMRFGVKNKREDEEDEKGGDVK